MLGVDTFHSCSGSFGTLWHQHIACCLAGRAVDHSPVHCLSPNLVDLLQDRHER